MGAIIFTHNQLWVIVFLGFCLANFFPYFTTEIQGEGTGDYPPPNEGDWVIRNETHVQDEIIIINGSINVLKNATLILNNVTILFNSSLSEPLGIYVYGELKIFNSNITALRGAYIFQVDGNMTIKNSEISRVTGGISIDYGEVLIANSTIFNNLEYAMVCLGNPILDNNTIYSNYGGILTGFGAAPIICNNTITSNEWGIICNSMGFARIRGNYIFNNSLGGIIVELGQFEIHSNIIASNGGFGVRSDHATINANNNIIYDNERWGIFSLGTPITQENNSFEKDGRYNGEGDVLQEWEVEIKIFDAKNKTLNLVNLTIHDRLDNLIWTGDTIGNVRTVILREYELFNNGSELVHTPFTIKAKKGTSSNSTNVVVNDNINILIVLDYKADSERKEYEFPFWGLAVVAGIWLFVFIMVIAGIAVTIRNKKR
jgi:parallel beta-helix repeat protein